MATVGDLATAALKELGVLASGETLSAEDGADALAAFNRMVDQWAGERLMIYEEGRTTYNLVASTRDYTVGTSYNFNVARPVQISHFSYYDSSAATPTEIPLDRFTDEAWAALPQKTATSPAPAFYYYNPTFPSGTLSLWPTPTGSTLVGVLYAPKQVSEFAAVATAVSLPPGFARMIVKNLALELAPSYGRSPAPALVEAARDSKYVVKRSNFKPFDLNFDYGALISSNVGYDIRTE